MATLHLHSVSKSFGSKNVLSDISFELSTGEVLGLFGRNGCGKSTLLKILFGTLKANEISLSIDGLQVNPSEVIRNKLIGYLPQHPFLPKQTKVRDLIPVYHPSEETQDAIFYDPHIASFTAKKVGSLSLGELKYFEVVLLGHLSHPFLVLDEPFSMLEPLHKEQLKGFITKLKTQKGIIITDHYYNDVLDITSQNIVLVEGKSHSIKTTADLKNFEYLSGRH